MPTYTYEHAGDVACDLGREFEQIQSIKEDRLTECPECGRKVKRLISGGSGSPVFKGAGWTPKHYV